MVSVVVMFSDITCNTTRHLPSWRLPHLGDMPATPVARLCCTRARICTCSSHPWTLAGAVGRQAHLIMPLPPHTPHLCAPAESRCQRLLQLHRQRDGCLAWPPMRMEASLSGLHLPNKAPCKDPKTQPPTEPVTPMCVCVCVHLSISRGPTGSRSKAQSYPPPARIRTPPVPVASQWGGTGARMSCERAVP